MTLVFRYILGSYLRVFLLALATFLILFQVIDFVERFGHYFRHDPATADVVALVMLKTLPALAMVIPVATLLGSVIALAILNRSNELIAMRAAGIGFRRLARPLLVCGMASAILVISLNEWILPPVNERINYLESVRIGNTEEISFYKKDQIWFKDGSRIYYIDLFLPTDGLLRGITLYELGPHARPVKRMSAAEGEVVDGKWTFSEVQALDMSDDARITTREHLPFDYGVDALAVLEKHPEEMNFAQLREFIAKLRQEGVPTHAYETEMHARFAFGLVSILLAVVGLPFAVKPARHGGAMAGVSMAIAAGFSYWLVFSFVLTLGKNGALPPMLAAWTPNLLFLGAAIFFHRKMG